MERSSLNVAQVACGEGALACRWAARGHQVYAADEDRQRIARARQRARAAGLEVLFEVAAASALPWPDRSMDLCFAPAGLDQLPQRRACLAEMVRVLRPGGILYASNGTLLFTRHAIDCCPAATGSRCCCDPRG